MFIVATVLFAAVFSPVLTPHDPLNPDSILDRNAPPMWMEGGSSEHILGADEVGRDILSRLIRASRITVIVVGVSTAVGVISGTALGLITGYFGGWIDEIVMRIVDMWGALPYILIILTIVVVFGGSFPILVISLALLSWPGAVRLVRAETLRLRSRDYVLMAKTAGANWPRILYRHILPGVWHIVIVTATLQTGNLILTEATLSFLGAGVPQPEPSWGSMASGGRNYLRDAWWVSVIPSIAIGLVVLAGNFLGDWIRDRLDPTLRQL